MLEAIVTGYEAQFDFPARDAPPSAAYLLATVPRTGSTWLSHLLWRTGCLGAPLEYLNFDPAGPYGHASGSPAAQHSLWSRALARRTSPNGIFGLKAFPMQLQDLVESDPVLLSAVMQVLLPRGGPPRIIHLRRRDRSAHVISYARASLSGIWRAEQEEAGAATPDYSDAALATAERWLASQERAWEQMFAELRIFPLTLWYEDVAADPDAAVRAVADHLGVALDPAAAVAVPEIRRQAQDDAERWAARQAGSSPI